MPPHEDEVLKWIDYLPQETLFWRRSLWEKIGASFDINFRFAMDWDLIIRFIKADARFERLPKMLGAFRVHNAQKTITQMNVGLQEMDWIRKRVHGYIPTRKEVQTHIASYLRRSVFYHYLYYLGIRK